MQKKLALMPNARPRCRSVRPLSWRSGDRWTNDVAPGDAVLFAQPLGRGDGVGALASVLAAQHSQEFYELVGEGRNSFRRGVLLRGAVGPSPAFSLFGFCKLPVLPAA